MAQSIKLAFYVVLECSISYKTLHNTLHPLPSSVSYVCSMPIDLEAKVRASGSKRDTRRATANEIFFRERVTIHASESRSE